MTNKSVFLIISHMTGVAKGVNTSVKGNSTNPENIEAFENMLIVDRLRPKHEIGASVIIDLVKAKVIYNRFTVDDTTVFREYIDRYRKDINGALKQWAAGSEENYLALLETSLAQSVEAELSENLDIEGEIDDQVNSN